MFIFFIFLLCGFLFVSTVSAYILWVVITGMSCSMNEHWTMREKTCQIMFARSLTLRIHFPHKLMCWKLKALSLEETYNWSMPSNFTLIKLVSINVLRIYVLWLTWWAIHRTVLGVFYVLLTATYVCIPKLFFSFEFLFSRDMRLSKLNSVRPQSNSFWGI